MRYLGNKDSIVPAIIDLLDRKGLLDKKYSFFDAFCGTGSVSNALKEYYNLTVNDNLLLASTYCAGRLFANQCTFKNLNFDPIEYFNNSRCTSTGFFSLNYAPELSNRMYFSDYNAGRIDYFRETIELWKDTKKINSCEYFFLLACLLESVSKVANIAGVYGAFLKTWDPRAIKPIKFISVDFSNTNSKNRIDVYNENLHDIVDKIDCDIIYLDPPYTKNKYSVQYHLLETLIRNDKPELKGITGTRDLSWVSQKWSTPYDVEIEFEYTIAKTKAKHILFSYSSDGLMSKEYILNVLKRHCKKESIDFLEIPYKKYRNYKTETTDMHFEYLFYAEKLEEADVSYYCPLNYMGGKTNIIHHIKPYLEGKKKLFDIMGGGFNVGINSTDIKNVFYNDINFIVKDILTMFLVWDTKSLLSKIDKIIKLYSLEKKGKNSYLLLRSDYNNKYRFQDDYTIFLYTMLLYGFQQQLRFNSNYEFNNPIGESGYNESIKEKIVSFSRKIKELNIELTSLDYYDLIDAIDSDSLVYIDPPYLITLGSYNDGKRGFNGWNTSEELRLISFIDKIKSRGCRIVLSNMLEYKGNVNICLQDWVKINNPIVKHINVRGRNEVLIIYETNIPH